LGCHAIFGNEFFHIFFLREALDVGWNWLIDSSIVKDRGPFDLFPTIAANL
jgi:hypothetical protein